MNLYFMRHGIAADRAAGATADDRSRMLTPKGVKRIEKEAQGMLRLSLSFDRILSSPLERARETAKIVAQALQLEDRLEEFEQLEPGHSARDLLSGLANYAGKKQILLIGHEPLLSQTVSFLLSEKAGAQIELKKGGLCCLELDAVPPRKSATLQWALAPKHLRLMAR
jgi:phosphohistidine phosphatase